MRKNGFEGPRNAMQISTWVLLPSLLVQFLLCVTPGLPIAAAVVVSFVFVVFAAATAYYGYMSSVIDPVDDRLRRHMERLEQEQMRPATGAEDMLDDSDSNEDDVEREASPFSRAEISEASEGTESAALAAGGGSLGSSSAQRRRSRSAGSALDERLSLTKRGAQLLNKVRRRSLDTATKPVPQEDDEADETDTKFCWVCQTRVHVKSMHCKFCDKCVGEFDHHCQWLNTCVGKNNYRFFFKTVCALTGFLATHTLCSAAVVVSYFLQKYLLGGSGPTMQRLAAAYGGKGNVGNILLWINVVFLAGVILFLGLIVQLLFFHMGLQKKRISTYEYIIKDNVKKREKKKKNQELTSKRNRAISERKREGKSTLWYVVGAYLPCCDPLKEERRIIFGTGNSEDQRDRRQNSAQAAEVDATVTSAAVAEEHVEQRQENANGTTPGASCDHEHCQDHSHELADNGQHCSHGLDDASRESASAVQYNGDLKDASSTAASSHNTDLSEGQKQQSQDIKFVPVTNVSNVSRQPHGNDSSNNQTVEIVLS